MRSKSNEPMNDRPCTCHPDDNPPVPCTEKYALTECRKVRCRWTDYKTGWTFWIDESGKLCRRNYEMSIDVCREEKIRDYVPSLERYAEDCCRNIFKLAGEQ